MDIIQTIITKLPHSVEFEGVSFDFELIHDITEMRLSYGIGFAEQSSPHYRTVADEDCWINPFIGDGAYNCNFLYLYEGIYNISDLEVAVEDCLNWLKEHKLLSSNSDDNG